VPLGFVPNRDWVPHNANLLQTLRYEETRE
jgi:hypothetical protein